MKCPNCHNEVEPGNFYCQHCLTEIPWVKEFDTVETQMEKKKREQIRSRIPVPSDPFSLKWVKDRGRTLRSRIKRKGRSILRWAKRRKLLLLLCFLAAAVLSAVFGYLSQHTFTALYRQAEEAFQTGDYREALRCVQLALEKDAENPEGNMLMGEIMEASGDSESAVMIYQGIIRQEPGNAEAYGELMRLLVKMERTEDVKAIMDECRDASVRAAMKDYICEEPEFSLEEGTYTSRQKLELLADYGRIYYTLDGSTPTENSLLYKGGIAIYEGTTIVSALGVNDLGIRSGVVSREYIVVSGKPEAPQVSPESGDYEEKTRIEVQIPDGCRVYYAFDEIPTEQSTEYTVPISMPAGYHVFYAIAVSANGEVSDPAVCTYYLQY